MTIEVADDVRGLTRTGLEMKKITSAWRGMPNGDRFTQALVTFLGSKSNKGTQRVYGFAISEFFNWYRSMRGIYPLPNQVTRADAVLFVKYLQERNLGLDELRLAQDPDRELDLAVYKYIKQNPEARISAIRRFLLQDPRFVTVIQFPVRGTMQSGRVLKIEENEPHGDDLQKFTDINGFPPDNALDLRLACLCMHNLLRRAPTIAQIREGQVNLDIPNQDQAQITFRVDPEVFRYFANEYTEQKGTDRSGTIATKLSALSSFWTWLVRSSGENLPGYENLLKFNIWREAIQGVRATAINRAKAHRESSTPDRELFLRLLSSCYVTSHGADALMTANAALEGADVARFAQAEPSIYDLRDRAVLIFCYWTGVRAEELGSIRRSAFDAKTGLVTITGKGDLTRIIRAADPAVKAIVEFQRGLDLRAEEKGASIFAKFIADDQAPLFPPLKLWGRAARISPTTPSELPGISPSGLARMLHERAEQIGIEQGSDDYYKIHPHGLRHLAALEANRRGVDVATIQATLGHGSLATTGIYLEVRDPMRRSLQPDQPPPKAEPPVVTIEAEAEVAPEAAPAPRARVLPALPGRPGAPQTEAAKPKAKPPAEGKRRVVSFETEVQSSAAERAVEAASKASAAATEAARAANEAVKAASQVAKTIEATIPEVVIAPVEREEAPFEVSTPPEELIEAPSEEAVEMAAEPKAVEKLLKAYETNWGDKGDRTHLVEQRSRKQRETEAKSLGADVDIDVGEEGLMTHAYIGKRTSFGWWSGTLGGMGAKLAYRPNVVFPAMPILSQSQFSSGLPDNNPIEKALSDLYEEWAQAPDRGLTSSEALLSWLRLAVDVSGATDAVLRERDGEWVPFDSALVKEPDPTKPSIVREHLSGAVIAWFRSTAWQWRPAAKGVPDGLDWDPPNWYDDPDPIASMPDAERADLLEWLRVLTGNKPDDRTPRFRHGASRFQVGQVLQNLCAYENFMQEVAESEAAGQRSVSPAEKKLFLENYEMQLKDLVKRATKGAVTDFSYSAKKAERKKERSQIEIERQRSLEEAQKEGLTGKALREKIRESSAGFSRMLRGFFLSVLSDVFGDEVLSDPFLSTQALCTQGAPLGDDEYRALFAVKGQTIQHPIEFARDYARRYGAHSECVARRLARHLWEQKRFDYLFKQGKPWLQDPIFNAYRLYRHPCPPAQEQDLRNLIGSSRRDRIRQSFALGGLSGMKFTKEMREAGAIGQEMEEYSARAESAAAQEFARDVLGGYEENPKRGLRPLNPVKLFFVSNYMRRLEGLSRG